MIRLKTLKPTEDGTQRVIVDGLRLHGYLVQITTRRVKRCKRCGAWPKSGAGDGVSRGVADLLVRWPGWPRGMWLALEVKRPGPVRYSSVEQRIADVAGDIIVVQSFEDALAAVQKEGV